MHKKNKKIIVFLSSCASVTYYATLFNYISLPVLDLHGKQKQQKRTSTFFEFHNAESGILICTDVAARGLDVSLPACPYPSVTLSDPNRFLLSISSFSSILRTTPRTTSTVSVGQLVARTARVAVCSSSRYE